MPLYHLTTSYEMNGNSYNALKTNGNFVSVTLHELFSSNNLLHCESLHQSR